METQQLSIMERVKTFEDALALADEQTREEYLKSVEGFNTPDEIAYKKLKLITKVVNEGWVADYTDFTQRKYYLWGGSLYHGAHAGLLCAPCSAASGVSSVSFGSRLNFESREKALFVGNQFLDLWNEYLL